MTGTHETLTKPVADFLALIFDGSTYEEVSKYDTKLITTTFVTPMTDVEFTHTTDGKLVSASVYSASPVIKPMTISVYNGKLVKMRNDGLKALNNTKLGKAFYQMVKEVHASAC